MPCLVPVTILAGSRSAIARRISERDTPWREHWLSGSDRQNCAIRASAVGSRMSTPYRAE